MPTGDAYSSGHLVPSLWDLHMFFLLRPIFFRTCRYFTGLCPSNIPRYFLDFASNSRHQCYNIMCNVVVNGFFNMDVQGLPFYGLIDFIYHNILLSYHLLLKLPFCSKLFVACCASSEKKINRICFRKTYIFAS